MVVQTESEARRRNTHAERMAAPPAEYMSVQTFGGDEAGAVLYANEYTWGAVQAAALRWAAEPTGGRYLAKRHAQILAVPAADRVRTMQVVLATSGVEQRHFEAGGYLNGWLSYLRQRWTAALLRQHAPAPAFPQQAVQVLPAGHPEWGAVTVRAHVRYTHRVTIDGVDWSVQSLLSRMQGIEECDSDRGFASMHGNGEDTVVAELLERHAGLQSRGGYHSAPDYDPEKWAAFRQKLEAVAQLTHEEPRLD